MSRLTGMNIQPLDNILRGHSFFQGLSEKYISLIAGCSKNIHVKKGTFLFRENQPANEFFLVREGKLLLEIASGKSGAIPIQTIHIGEVLGWAAIFPPYKWQFDALVQESTRAISINAKCLRGKCDADPALGYELMKRFAAVMLTNLHSTRLQLLDAIEEAKEYHV